MSEHFVILEKLLIHLEKTALQLVFKNVCFHVNRPQMWGAEMPIGPLGTPKKLNVLQVDFQHMKDSTEG